MSDDHFIVIAQDWPTSHDASVLFPYAKDLFSYAASEGVGLAQPVETVPVEAKNAGEDYSYVLSWTEQPARSFQYGRLLLGIANADHGRAPAISSRVYFLNLQTDTLPHMYDDRGLDVIARQGSALIRLYIDFQEWILDYDRERMDRIFAADAAS